MSTGSSAQASTYPAGGTELPPGSGADAGRSSGFGTRERRGRIPRLRDARIRSKLALILFVPLLAVLALATVRLVDVGGRALDARQVEDLTRLSTDISRLTQYLHKERMAAAQYLADPAAKPDGFNAAIEQSDARIQEYTADRAELDEPPAAVADRLTRIDDHLQTMDATRTKITDRDEIAISEAVLRYSVVITDLVGYGEVLSQYAGEGTVADSLRAVSAFARAKAGTAEQEAVAYAARASGDLSAEQLSVFTATQTSQQEALEGFALVATPAQRSLVDNTVTGDAVNLADGIATRLSRSDPIEPLEITQSFGAVVDLMRWAEQRLEQQTLAEAVDESSSVARQAAVETSLVLLTLILAVALAVVLARSLNQSLRRLREGALAVANRDLPDAVARLRDARNLGDGGADDIVRQVRDPIRLNNRDEVGQVAQAFNVVHREAVRIAAEQAALRTSVSAMFLNLARRSQSLVDRMIGELDQIERGEEDPKRLAQLFELDHLATRMRRNDENLLVLAGADSSAPRREDALVVDALRAAQSEVELYNRIEFGTVDTDISIMAVAVNDVVRLVAELLDNATRFSPPNTVVVADGRRIRDYVVIQVEDRGLGMSEEQMDSLNRRLAETPDVDVAAFRLMGLAVVSRLASRYGIRVELRANIEGGTVAQVVLPNHIVILPNSRSVDGPRGNRQLDPGPASWNDPMPLGRSSAATATLPAVSGEPWGQRSGGFPAITAQQPPHPQLPVPPSHLPGRGNDLPSPDRPALPKRGDAQPGERPPLPVRVPQPADPAPAYGAGSPTMAYPAVTTAAPDRGGPAGLRAGDGLRHPTAPGSRRRGARRAPTRTAGGPRSPPCLRRRRPRYPRWPARPARPRRSSSRCSRAGSRATTGRSPGNGACRPRAMRHPRTSRSHRPRWRRRSRHPSRHPPRHPSRHPLRRRSRPRSPRPPRWRPRRPWHRRSPSHRTQGTMVRGRRTPARTTVRRRCPGHAGRPRKPGAPPPTMDGSGRWRRRNPSSTTPPAPDYPSGFHRPSSSPVACRTARATRTVAARMRCAASFPRTTEVCNAGVRPAVKKQLS
ncbi:nitrate- and nitrite sensing domain-containing protein [Actinoplanes digitatis]|uniref:sensor histidine kinase n=1 Tax=Actinoplanes digitatis TaxID=1868 RepID=UPI003A94FA19